MTNEEVIKLVLETTGVKGLSELATQAYDTAKALAEVGEKADEVKKKTIDLQALAGAGQGLFSAFQSGELPGIIKGVGELVDLVPALNTFAPAIKKIGEASEYAWPMAKELWAQATAPAKVLDKAIEKVTDYGERVNELGETVKNLTERTGEETEALNKENKALEEQVKQIEKLNALKSTQADEEEEEIKRQDKIRAAHLKAAVGGQQEDIIEELANQRRQKELTDARQQLEQMTQEALRHPETLDAKLADKLYARIQALMKGIPKDIQDKARGEVARALIGGGEADIDALAEGLARGGRLRGRILDASELTAEEKMSPKQKAAAKKAADLTDQINKGLDEDKAEDDKRRAAGAVFQAQRQEAQIELGRRAGAAAAKARQEQISGMIPKGLDVGRIPFAQTPEDVAKAQQADALKAAQEEILLLQTLMMNQGNLTRQQRALLQYLQRTAQQVGAAIGEGRSALTNGFQN